MNQTPEISEHVWKLFDAAIDQSLSDENRLELETLLLASDPLRRLFLAHLQLRTDIRFWSRARRGADQVLSGILDLSKITPADQPSELHVSKAIRSRSWLDRAAKRPTWPSLAITVLIVVSVVGWMAVTYLPERTAESSDKKSKDELREPAAEPTFVALLNHRHNAVWLNGTRPSKYDPRLKVGRRLSLASGVVEVKYYTGAIVVIEGPAEFYVGSESGNGKAESGKEGSSLGREPVVRDKQHNSGYLKHGSLVARVEGEDAKGFTVNTSTASFEDLGTEFGVEIDQHGRGSMHVFEGRVKMYRVSEQGEHIAAREFSAGSSAQFASNAPFVTTGLVAERGKFITTLPRAPTSADIAAIFEQNECVAHWRFESVENGIVKNTIADRHDATMVGKVDFRTTGNNGFAEFAPGGVGRLEVPGDPQLDDIGHQLTLMAWVKTRDNGAIIHKWRGVKGYTLEIHNDKSGFVLGDPIAYHLAPPEPLPLGRWVHIVGTYDGRTMRLYQNGREVAHYDVPQTGAIIEPYDGPLVLGARSDAPSAKPLAGQLDEAVVLRKALTAEQIKTIYEAYRAGK